MDLLQGRIVRAGVKTDGWYLQTCFLWRQQLLFTDGITGAATSAVNGAEKVGCWGGVMVAHQYYASG